MKNVTLRLAVLSALCLASAQVVAAGFVAVPAAGFTSSAYTSCFNTGRTAGDPKGNFGSYPIASTQFPASGTNDTCWVAKPATILTLPSGKTGFTLVGSQNVAIPNPLGGASASIGNLDDVAWRNSTTGVCIIGTRVTLNSGVDSDAAAGTQLFELNDIARGGFSAAGSVNVAYTLFLSPPGTPVASSASPVYRVGRTFTSVQHRALKYDTLANKALNGTNYLDLPTKNSFTGATNGEAAPILATTTASTTAATQDAAVDANYVDFTMDAVYVDDDGTPNPQSAFTYIEASCGANPTLQADAVRLRQTGQENATQKQINMTGYAIGTP